VAYPTAAELVDESEVTALQDLTTEAAEDLWRAAIRAVEGFCGQSFESVDETRLLSGTGSDVLYLPRRLESLTTLEVLGTSLDLTSVTMSDARDRLVVTPASFGNYAVRAMRDYDDPRLFPYGNDNVTITGTWGWTAPPDEVRLALRLDLEDNALADSHALSETIRAARKLGLTEISQGNLRASLSSSYGLSERVQTLLADHVWYGGVGSLV
jgi:hypothetical protein